MFIGQLLGHEARDIKNTEFDFDMRRVPKHLRRIAVRGASHPTAR